MSQVNQTLGSGETVTFQLTTTMPCQLTTILGPNRSTPRTICFHKLLEAMEDQGWERKGDWVQEEDTVTAKYWIFIPPADPVASLAALQGVLPAITPPTDGEDFAEATFPFSIIQPVATIKAPAHWWPQDVAP